MVRLFAYKKKEGSSEIVDKVDKTINHLASITGTLLSYDKGALAHQKTDYPIMKSIDLQPYLRDTKVLIDGWWSEVKGMKLTARMMGMGFLSSMAVWFSMGKYRTASDFLNEYGHTMYMSLRIINTAKLSCFKDRMLTPTSDLANLTESNSTKKITSE